MSAITNRVKNQGFKLIVAAVLIAAVAFAFVVLDGRDKTSTNEEGMGGQNQGGRGAILFWTCSMHTQIKRPGPGLCPICGMKLIPVYASKGVGSAAGALGEREIRLSKHDQKLAEIEESPVVKRAVGFGIRMVGLIDYDERKVRYITAWVPGRIDKLYINFTGKYVHKGDPMVQLYSPDLYSAQQEFIEASRAYDRLKSSSLESIRTTAREMVRAARKKLRLLGVSKKQIAETERKGTAADHITINAPVSGVVIHKAGFEGMYVKTGTKIYTVADLSDVWTKMDAYESDLIWLKEGQQVHITTEAYPGEMFGGEIEFIDPFLTQKTRTAKVRVTTPNPEGKLKPEMFVHATVRVTADDIQRVISKIGEHAGTPLTVPVTAPLITGKRAVVYVADPTKDGVYEGREVVLGPRAGDYYFVLGGLREGEMVVTNGAFKIDSALQIRAKPSMMNPSGGGEALGHAHHGAETMEPELKPKGHDVQGMHH